MGDLIKSKKVGVIAGIIALMSIIAVVMMIFGGDSSSKSDKTKIEKMNEGIMQEINSMANSGKN